MSRALPIALMACLAAAAPARGEGLPELPGVEGWEGPGSWRLSGALWWTSAVALETGMPLGVVVDGYRRVGKRPVLFGLRLGFARSTEAGEGWALRHDHAVGAAVARVESSHGPGLLYAQFQVGAMAVLERARRHQFERLEGLGIRDVERFAWSIGPWAGFEAGVSVRVRGGLSASVGGGPTMTVQKVDGHERRRWGLLATLGVSHAF